MRLWDADTLKLRSTYSGKQFAVTALAFAPDGKTLASCAADRTVKLWDWATGRRTTTLSESTGELAAVAFTPDDLRKFEVAASAFVASRTPSKNATSD